MTRPLPLASAALAALAALTLLLGPGCRTVGAAEPDPRAMGEAGRAAATSLPRALDPLLEELEQRTFRWFWDKADPVSGLTPDREPTPSFCSVAAMGFGFASYAVGAERGWVTREQAAARTLSTLEFLWALPQGPEPAGRAGYKGFFYHFVDMHTGLRWSADVELSSIDTSLLLAGTRVARGYFDGANAGETRIRELADLLYDRVEWDWMQPRKPLVAMGWTPEHGFGASDWHGYDEALILFALGHGSQTHPLDAGSYDAYVRTYRWASWRGQAFLQFGPLFGHQFSAAYLDLRGIRDAYMRMKKIDYFENGRRATISQRNYAKANPKKFKDYSKDIWGVSACDGPGDMTLTVKGRSRRFIGYAGRGVGALFVLDDGTITPMAAASSLPFAPEFSLPALQAMRAKYGTLVYGEYGFVDAFNPTFPASAHPAAGQATAQGWFDTDRLGIDQGPIVLMIENYRSELLWRVTRTDARLAAGLRACGFGGGWLDAR